MSLMTTKSDDRNKIGNGERHTVAHYGRMKVLRSALFAVVARIIMNNVIHLMISMCPQRLTKMHVIPNAPD